MPQPRRYASNAERQAAYRRRKAAADAAVRGEGRTPGLQVDSASTPGTRALVERVLKAGAVD